LQYLKRLAKINDVDNFFKSLGTPENIEEVCGKKICRVEKASIFAAS
jgi:hypothetical protein